MTGKHFCYNEACNQRRSTAPPVNQIVSWQFIPNSEFD